MGQISSTEEPPPEQATMSKSRATIFPNPSLDAEAASEELYKSMKGWGTDEDTLMQVLVKHSNAQRQEIREKYQSMFGEDLLDRIKGEVDGHFQDFLVGLLNPTVTYEAECLKDAMKGAGTNEDVLIEILVGKSNYQIDRLKREFQKLADKDLDEAVANELSGPLRNIIRALLTGNREENWGDATQAQTDAQELYDAGIVDWGTDESKFNQILCTRSFPHLTMVFRKYAQIAEQDIAETISSEFSGNAKDAFLAIVKEARDTTAFFAERLHDAMAGAGTRDHSVIRILITRSELDLADIKDKYQEMYGESLADKVKGEAHGDYEKALLLVLGEQPE